MKPDPQASSGSERTDAADRWGGEAALAWVRASGRGGVDFERRVRTRVRTRARRRAAAFGTVAALVLLAVVALHRPAGQPDATPATAAPVLVAGVRTQVLPDGTVVDLSEDAMLAVDFTADGSAPRRVRLERGTVHFAVQKDPARPFVVFARGAAVRAVGTAFSVALEPRAVEVLVTEGRVAVGAGEVEGFAATPTPDATIVDAGFRVRLEPGAGATPVVLTAVSEVEQRERLAWRVPLLELSGTPLAEVVASFNRHAPRPLALADPVLGELRVSGLLRADNTPALLKLLQNEFGLVAREEAQAIVLARP